MNKMVLSWGVAGGIYRDDPTLLRDWILTHVGLHPNGIAFKVFEDKDDRCCVFETRDFIVIGQMGTHNKAGWMRNFDLELPWEKNKDGIHDGFQKSGDWTMSQCEYAISYAKRFGKTIILCGHSAGAGIIQYVGVRIAEEFGVKCFGYAFANPPTFTSASVDRYTRVNEQDLFELVRVNAIGDPVAHYFRTSIIPTFDGADIGTEIILPAISWIQRVPLLRAFAHSPHRIMHGGLVKLYQSRWDFEDVNALETIKPLLIN